MVSSLASFTIFLLILSISCSLPSLAYCMGGFSIDLLHRELLKSHLLTSKSTRSSRLNTAIEQSFARAIYFRDSMKNINSSYVSTSLVTDNIFSQIFSIGFEYFMKIYIGSQAEEVHAIADTGSDLIWLQCKPCDGCYPKNAPLFETQDSSTYKYISCYVDSCSADLRKGCGPESQCEFKYQYGDMSGVQGFLANDTFSFESNDKDRVLIPMIKFGCTHHTEGAFNEHVSAFVGLGGGRHSLIRQLGSTIENKFSYCLTSFKHASHTSRLNFGSNAVVSGSNSVTTPILTNSPNTFYFLSLEKISVEGQGDVTVKPLMKGIKGNIIIDSGTPLTLIDNETLQSVERKILSSVKHPKVVDPKGKFNLCYKASGEKLPSLTFHFSNGAAVLLQHDNTFIQHQKEMFCLALVSSHEIGFNIFGNFAQQNFHIGFDLSAMKLTIAPADCAKL